VTSLTFGAAAASFALGLAGRSGSWLVAMVVSLALLTVGFFLAGGGSRGD
jgi:hypothetical protein